MIIYEAGLTNVRFFVQNSLIRSRFKKSIIDFSIDYYEFIFSSLSSMEMHYCTSTTYITNLCLFPSTCQLHHIMYGSSSNKKVRTQQQTDFQKIDSFTCCCLCLCLTHMEPELVRQDFSHCHSSPGWSWSTRWCNNLLSTLLSS